jgi:hypothetical protein
MKFIQIIRGQKQLSFLDIHRPPEVVNIIKYLPREVPRVAYESTKKKMIKKYTPRKH